ncbi:MAG TPA: Arc family DNA-binding protein [Spirochaetales bacterium]|nr:Arc family DNA-binding protein [Spirochaetales bacterium]HRY53451.1 Arc family DNA-binding protein [Spirochaetia bacterium]
MPSFTLRNIPESLLEGLRILSERERRSLNNELLVVLEEGLAAKAESAGSESLGPELQASLWMELCGKWEDERSAEAIIEDIRSARSMGREVSL